MKLKRVKYVIGIIIAFIAMIALFSIKNESNAATTYKNGNYATATLSNGTLTIEGVFVDHVLTDKIPRSEQLKVTSIVIKSGVKGIGRDTFYHSQNTWRNVKNITIPNTMKSIGDYAFTYLTGLQSIRIPNSVTSIGEGVFWRCSNLSDVKFEKGITAIPVMAFCYCTNLKNVSIPSSVTLIDKAAFYGCSKLNNIVIPNSVTLIDDSAFYGCSKLNNIVIPNSVTEIGSDTFGGCGSLTTIILPSNLKKIRSATFLDCAKLSSITIPKGVTIIDIHAFEGCSSLSSIDIPNSVTSIGDYAFRHCSSLSSIDIPNSVTSIGHSAFYECSSLSSIDIPNSVTGIESFAFGKCTNLMSITISKNVKELKKGALYGCTSLREIHIKGKNTTLDKAFSDLNNVSITKYSNLIIYCPSSSEALKYAKDLNLKYCVEEDANITKSTTNWTNKAVTITITVPESNPQMSVWRRSVSLGVKNRVATYSVSDNGTYTFGVQYPGGVIKEYAVKITNIDKDKPTITSVTGNPTKWTQSATLKIAATDATSKATKVKVNGTTASVSNGVANYKVTSNGTYSIVAVDSAGNESDAKTLTVNKLDKTKPTLTVTPSTTSSTKQNVTLTIKASDSQSGMQIVRVNGKEVKLTNGTGTYTVTSNGDYTVSAVDNAGNANTTKISISNIDKTAPQAIITGKAHGVTSGLIRHYDGNYNVLSGHLNSTTAWKDLAGKQNGTISGGAKFYNNGYLLLDGTDDWVNLGQITNLEKVTLDVEVVFPKFETGNKIIMCNYNSGGTGLQINNGQLMFVAHINGAFRYLKVPELLQVNKNYHITGTYDGTKMRIYVNGALQAEQEITGTIKNPLSNTVMAIGANPVGSNIVEGYNANMRLYAARVYNTALTESQIRQNMVSDRVKPAVIASNSEQIRLTIIFSEAVTGFDESDIVIQRVDSSGTEIEGAKANIKSGTFSGSGRLYGFTLENIPGSAYYKISIKDKSYTDAAGNQGKTASVMGYRDIAGPPVTITANTGDTTSASAVTYTINVKEYHTGLTKNDIEVTNGTKGAFTKVSDLEYTLVVTNSGNCEQTVSVSAGACHDKAGNPNTSASKTVTIDTSGLTCDVTSNVTKKVTNADIVSYTIEFNKPVVSFKAANITVTNGTIKILTSKATNQEYILLVEGGETGIEQTVQVKANECEDEAGNKNKASEVEKVKIDKVAPTITQKKLNTTDWSNGNVEITIKAQDEYTGISKIAVDGTTIDDADEDGVVTYEASTNKKYTIEVTDEAGNKVTDTVTVGNIDVKSPTLSVDVNTTDVTNENVALTVNAEDTQSKLKNVIIKNTQTGEEEEIEIGENGEGTYEIIENGTYSITATDNAGNETAKTIEVNNIDKEGPTIEVTKEPTTLTVNGVTLTVIAEDEQSGIAEENAYSFDGGETWQTENTKVYYENTSGIRVQVKDGLGNIGEYEEEIDITNIKNLSDFIKIEEYLLEEHMIKNVQPQTTIADFKTNVIVYNEEKVKILGKDNKELSDEDLIGTGSKIQIDADGEIAEYVIVVAGDTTGDGKVDLTDMILINKHRIKKKTLKNEYFEAGDVNNDGKIDIQDMIKVNKYRIGKITKL